MAIHNRDSLKETFSEGAKPTEEDFADLMESFLNLDEDGLSFDGDFNLVLSRGLQLGDSASTTPGTLRFNGAAVEFFDGTSWTEVGGGSAVFADVGGGNVTYGGGNVGIGNLSAAPSHLLDVAVGENTGPDQRVRFGNVICSNGPGTGAADAYFYHQNVNAANSYALRQRASGEVHLNAPSGEDLRFQHDSNLVRMIITGNGEVVVGFNNSIPGSGGAIFQVNGTAFKSSGGDTWDNTSDARVKKDVRDLELGLEAVKRIRPIRYRYTGKAGTIEDMEGIGVLGQEIEEVIPETVRKVPRGECNNTDLDDLRIYNSSALTYVLINSVKELSALVEQQQQEIAALKRVANDSEQDH